MNVVDNEPPRPFSASSPAIRCRLFRVLGLEHPRGKPSLKKSEEKKSPKTNKLRGAKSAKDEQEFDRLMNLAQKHADEKHPKKYLATVLRAVKIRPEDWELHRKIGWRYLFEENYEEALAHFQKVIELNGDRANAYCGIGAVEVHKGEFSSALDNLKRSLDLGFDDWILHYNLGMAYDELGDRKKAIKYLLKATERDCPETRCYELLGTWFFVEKKYVETEKQLRKAIEIGPDSVVSHYLLGRMYEIQNRFNPAIRHLKMSVKLDIASSFLHCNLGVAYIGRGLFKEAQKEFEAAIKVNAQDPSGYIMLSNLCAIRDNWDEAERFLKEARKRGIENHTWHSRLAVILHGKGRIKEAIKHNKMAIQNDPNDPSAYHELGYIYEDLDRTPEAILHIEKALQLDPTDLSGACVLAVIYEKEDRSGKSKRYFSRISLLNQERMATQIMLGVYHLNRGELNSAEKYAQRIIELDGHLFWGYYLLSRIYIRRKDQGRYLQYLAKAIELEPNLSSIDHLSLAIGYYQKRMLKKARACFESVIELEPDSGEAYLYLGIIIFAGEGNYSLACVMYKLSEEKPWRLFKKKNQNLLFRAKSLTSGMMYWQRGEFDLAKKCFLECAEMTEADNEKSSAKDQRFLASLVSLDQRFQLLSSAATFSVVKHELGQLIEDMAATVDAIRKETKKHLMLSWQIMRRKVAIPWVLMEILEGHGLGVRGKKALDVVRTWLEKLKLVESTTVFDLIETFAFEFQNALKQWKTTKQMPKKLRESLIGRLREIFLMAGGKMSLEVMQGKCWTILDPYLRNIQTEIMSRRGTLEDLDRFLKMQPEMVEEFREKEQAIQKRINVIFCEDRIEISGAKPFSKDYSMRLIERVILRRAVRGREKMHWLWAYVTFPKFKATNPKRQVRNYVSKKRRQLEKYGIRIMPLSREEDNFIILERISENVVSNIKDVMECYKEAVSLYEDEKPKEAIEKLSKIVESNYRWYSFTESYMQLAKWILEINFKGIPEDLIGRSKDFLALYGKKLKSGILHIEAYRRKIGTHLDEESEGELERIRKELEKVEKYLFALVERRPWAIEDDKYEVLAGLLQENREQLELIREENLFIGKREEEHNRLIENLQKENRQIREIIENSLEFWEREQERLTIGKTERGVEEFEDMKRWIHCSLAEIIEKLISFEDFEKKGANKLGSLKNYLFEELEKIIKRKLGISRY